VILPGLRGQNHARLVCREFRDVNSRNVTHLALTYEQLPLHAPLPPCFGDTLVDVSFTTGALKWGREPALLVDVINFLRSAPQLRRLSFVDRMFTLAELSMLSLAFPRLETLEMDSLWPLWHYWPDSGVDTGVAPFPVLNTIVLHFGWNDSFSSPGLLLMPELEVLIGMAPALHTLRFADAKSVLPVNFSSMQMPQGETSNSTSTKFTQIRGIKSTAALIYI
jgi:hypothetical protein